MLWFLHSFDSANLRLGFLALICSGRQDKKYLVSASEQCLAVCSSSFLIFLWSGAILG